jgi:sugar (pentulose or hexulose) kinase
MLYAALEGITFSVAANIAAMPSGLDGSVTMIGEGAKGRVWPQVMADVLGRPVNLLADPTSHSSLGVCRVAAAVLGWPAPENFERKRISPRDERMSRYDLLGEAFHRATDIARAFSPFLTI